MRAYLAGKPADPPPFLPFATDLAARLEQAPVARLRGDANGLARALLSAQQLFGYDGVVVQLPLDGAVGSTPAEVEAAAGAIERLRILAGDRAAVVLAVPGPAALTHAIGGDDLEDATDALLALLERLCPADLDVLAVVEPAVNAAGAPALQRALTPLWNATDYYGLACWLVAERSGPEAGALGADAVTVWDGAGAADLLAAGAACVGVPVTPGEPLPTLPNRCFHTTAGELPTDVDLEWLKAPAGASA